jgi:hypothetical protein
MHTKGKHKTSTMAQKKTGRCIMSISRVKLQSFSTKKFSMFWNERSMWFLFGQIFPSIVNLTFQILGMEKFQIWGGTCMCEEEVNKVYFQIG